MVSDPSAAPRRIWALTPGHAGMEQQALGLAQAIGGEVTAKRVLVRPPWRFLPGNFWLAPLAAAAAGPDRLDRPWPDLVVSCGRQAAPLAAALRAASGGRVRAVHVQNPLMRLSAFDLVVAPAHDDLRGANVLTTRMAPHGMTPTRLAAARTAWAGRLGVPGRPLVAVLIGAPGGRDGAADAARLLAQLALLADDPNLALAVTPSRRTSPEFRDKLRSTLVPKGAFVWDGTGGNPYVGMLALADALIVTEDSVSMISEALATGQGVLVAPFGGVGRRLRRFLQVMEAQGVIRHFRGRIERWTNPPLDDTVTVAGEIRRRLGWNGTDRS